MPEPDRAPSTPQPRTIDVLPAGPVQSTAPQKPSPAAGSSTGDVATLSRQRKVAALAVATISDGISMFSAFTPPVQVAVDVATAAALFGIMGFRWPLLPAVAIEAIPGLAVFPTWSVAVGVLVGVTPTTPSAPKG